jgi:hypothetical protein
MAVLVRCTATQDPPALHRKPTTSSAPRRLWKPSRAQTQRNNSRVHAITAPAYKPATVESHVHTTRYAFTTTCHPHIRMQTGCARHNNQSTHLRTQTLQKWQIALQHISAVHPYSSASRKQRWCAPTRGHARPKLAHRHEQFGRCTAVVKCSYTLARVLAVDCLHDVCLRFCGDHLDREDAEGLLNV